MAQHFQHHQLLSLLAGTSVLVDEGLQVVELHGICAIFVPASLSPSPVGATLGEQATNEEKTPEDGWAGSYSWLLTSEGLWFFREFEGYRTGDLFCRLLLGSLKRWELEILENMLDLPVATADLFQTLYDLPV